MGKLMKIKTTMIGIEGNHYFNVHADLELVGVIKLVGGDWCFNASAGSKGFEMYEHIMCAWERVIDDHPTTASVI